MPITHITAILLAAGTSSRMGRPKQLLDWGGVPLVRHVAEQALAAPVDEVLVVTGAAQSEVEAALAGLPLRCVYCADFAAGQSASLRAGIAALPPKTDAALVLLVDQPFVTAAILAQVITAVRSASAPIVAPVYQGRRGHPVCFTRPVFAELAAIRGDQGARAVLAADPGRVAAVAFDDPRPLMDIDTIAEYEAMKRQKAEDRSQRSDIVDDC
jgi:molybdenum cofactor cytidylyltransferase